MSEMKLRTLITLTLSLLFLGCQNSSNSTSIVIRSTTLCGQNVTLEIARTDEDKAQGLMNRSSLPLNHGMLFVYVADQILTFWMKNVSFPLSLGFFDSLGRLISSVEMVVENPSTPDHLLRRYSSTQPVRFAVEMGKDFFKDKEGCVIDLSFLRDL